MKIFYIISIISMIRRNFWQSLKKILYVGLRATLIFRKFKVALNPTSRIFLNFAKSCILLYLSFQAQETLSARYELQIFVIIVVLIDWQVSRMELHDIPDSS